MSLLIATLAYGGASPELAPAKVGVLAGSVIAGVGGFAILRGARSADAGSISASQVPDG